MSVLCVSTEQRRWGRFCGWHIGVYVLGHERRGTFHCSSGHLPLANH